MIIIARLIGCNVPRTFARGLFVTKTRGTLLTSGVPMLEPKVGTRWHQYQAYFDKPSPAVSNIRASLNMETLAWGIGGVVAGSGLIALEYYTLVQTGSSTMTTSVGSTLAHAHASRMLSGATLLGLGTSDIHGARLGRESMLRRYLLEVPTSKFDKLIKFAPYNL